VSNAGDVPTTDYDRVYKTDLHDAIKIARGLRAHTLKRVFVPSRAEWELRGLVRERMAMVQMQTKTKNRIRQYLHFNGIRIPNDFPERCWSRGFIAWLEAMTLSTEAGTLGLRLHIQMLLAIRRTLLDHLRAVRRVAASEPTKTRLEHLRSLPGIGPLGALILLSEIIDVKRFHRFDQLASYVGLVPSTNSTGGRERTTGITRRRNARLRALIRSHGMKGQAAIIRIARRLLRRVYFVMRQEQPFVTAPPPPAN
jgi:transposase